MAQTADLIVAGASLLPAAGADVLENHGVAVRDDVIVAVAPADELGRRFPQARVLDTPDGLVMPGLINMHTHVSMSCYRGLADDLPLMRWLEDYIFPAEAKLTPEVVNLGAKLSILEMIRSGTTSFCDMYLFSGEVANAAAECGMRAWVGEVLYDFPSPCYGPPEKGIELVRAMAEQWRDHPLISVTVEPHAVYTCSPDLLCALKDLARELDSPWIIHLSENREEVETAQERYGTSPASHLDRLDLLDGRTIAAHCVMLSDDEISMFAERGVSVVHCPESNMKLASGIAPVTRMLAAGVNVALGTDGSASNNDLDMFGEMTSAALLQKVAGLDPTLLPAADVLGMATTAAARALGMEGRLGVLAEGALADIIVIDTNAPHLTPMYSAVSHLVYAARGGDVIHSVIGGRVVMENRRITVMDEGDVTAAMRAAARDIAALFR